MPTPRRTSSLSARRATAAATAAGGGPPLPPLRRNRTAENMDRRKFRSSREGSPQIRERSPSRSNLTREKSPSRSNLKEGEVGWQRSTHSRSPTRRTGTLRSKSDGYMSSSSPGGFSERRAQRTPSPDIQDAREMAFSVLERIEKRASVCSVDSQELAADDAMERMNKSAPSASGGLGASRSWGMSQSTPGGASRGRGSSSFHGSFHSSVAKRFLEHPDDSEDSDEFDLKVGNIMGVSKYTKPKSGAGTTAKPPIARDDSWMGRLNESLHSLRSSTGLGAGGPGESNATLGIDGDDDDDEDDEMHDLDQDHSSSSEHEIHFEKSLFSNRLRQDLTQVDQSVNLMNAEAGKYDWSNRGHRRRGQHKHQNGHNSTNNKTMVEMFLSEKSSNVRRGFCDCGILCCLMILILIVAAAFLLTPYFDNLEWPSVFAGGNDNNNNAATPSPTSAPTYAPTSAASLEEVAGEIAAATKPPNAAEADTLETTKPLPPIASTTKSPFYEPDVVKQREKALEELLAVHDDVTTNTVAARKANAWIAAYDPAQLDLLNADNDTRLSALQRYALAVLFFVAHPNVQPNTAPHETTNTRQQSLKSLKSLKSSLRNKGRDDKKQNNEEEQEEEEELEHTDNQEHRYQRELAHLTFVDWMTASHVCWWEGISCNNNNNQEDPKRRIVDQINLAESRLYGTLPPQLGLLQGLEQLDLSHNRLQGEVPPHWAGSLRKLESLQLHDNELTGVVPTDFCQLDHLDTFTTDCQTTDMECDCCSECL